MISLPPGACDCHCHIFGPADRYPAVAPPGYALPTNSLEDYMAMAGRLGFERRVFVQPVTYGADSSMILDALRALGPETTRGIGGIPGRVPSDATLAEWHRLGMRGVRVNYTPYKPYEAGFTEATLPEVERAASLVRELGWVLDVLAPAWLTMELLPHLDRMRVNFTLCHFGKLPARDGVGHAEFQKLLGHVRDGEGGCHVKIAAAYQVSDLVDCADVAPLAQALYAAAPDRILWGTDWPHIRHEDRGDAAALLKLFAAWFPDAADRRRILVENPARLFGFAG
jgi:predicted TIM-barrel fold metal-dependent hydrolase